MTVRGANTTGIDDARSFLTERFGDQVTNVEALRAGGWSSAFGFERNDGRYVIRFSAHADDFARDQLARHHAASGLPVPLVTEIGEAFGRSYAISERATGLPIDDVDERHMRSLLPAVFGALDAMRLADLTGTQGYGNWGADQRASFRSWTEAMLSVDEDPPGSRTHGWRDLLRRSEVGDAAFDESYARLVELVAFAPRDRHLIHSDLLNYNVLVAGNRLTAVIDWGCAMYGDFLYDLAWLVFWWPWRPAWQAIDILAEAKSHYVALGIVIPDFEERLRLCLLHIGLSNLAYVAWIGRWDQARDVSARTLAYARGEAPDNLPKIA